MSSGTDWSAQMKLVSLYLRDSCWDLADVNLCPCCRNRDANVVLCLLKETGMAGLVWKL